MSSHGGSNSCFTPPTVLHGSCRLLQKELDALIRDWAQGESMVLAHFDVEELVPRRSPRNLWDSDEIHMSAEGQMHLGRSLARILPSLLRNRRREPSTNSFASGSSSPVSTPPVPPPPAFFQQLNAVPAFPSGRVVIGGKPPSVACALAPRFGLSPEVWAHPVRVVRPDSLTAR